MKKLGNILFSRLVLIFLAIVIQFFWLATVLYQFSLQFTFINLGFRAVALILAIIISDKDGNAAGRMSWIFLILVAPIFGVTLYFVFGRAKLTKHTEERLERVNEELSPVLAGDEQVEEKIRNENKRIYNQMKYIKDWAGYPVCEYTKTEYYPSGEELFLKMLEAVKEAENFIFLEYFIFEDGIMLEQLLAALEEKVKQGVEVRMIYDDVGSWSLSKEFIRELRKSDIQIYPFLPVRFHHLANKANYRNHRKIAVVDGEVGFVGGLNIADRYMDGVPGIGIWRDTHLKVTSGPAIAKPGEMAAILSNLQEGDLLFVDEIHRLNRQVEEVLYPAMEDYAIDIMMGKGASARSIRLDLPKFTLVGATTRAGLLSAPLRDRFGVVHHLEFYTPEELKVIIQHSAIILGVEIDEKGALELARLNE